MTVINTNTASINAQYNLGKMQKSMDEAMQALSSGKRINSAADDAAGLSIVTRMESQVRGLNQAIRNAGDAMSLVDTAEGAMDEITNMLQRVRELAVQASNGVNNAQDRQALENEVDQLVSEIGRIASDTTFNNQKLLDGTYNGNFQIGMQAGQTVSVGISNMSASVLGKSGNVAGQSSQITEGSAAGKSATVTNAQLALHGVDTYTFQVNGVSVSGSVEPLNSASVTAFVSTINNNLKNAGKTEVVASVASSGSIDFKNTKGDAISITNFASSGNGTASFTPIVGTGTAKLLDDTGAEPANSAVGKQSSTFGVTLRLDANGEYGFKVNNKQINVASTDSISDIATKIETALGGTYEAILSTDNATTDAAAEAYRTHYNSTNTATIAQGTMATMFSQAADEIIIFNTNTGVTSEINITDFSVTDGAENGTLGMIDVASPVAEARLVDGTMYFESEANETTKIAELDFSFSSTSSDYVIKIDGESFRVQSEKIKDGTAAAALITAMNASTTMNGGRTAAAGLGSLGNAFTTSTPAAAKLVSGTPVYTGDETSATFKLSIDGGNTVKTVTLDATNVTDQAGAITSLQNAVDTAFGSGVITVAADTTTAANIKLETTQKGSGYAIDISDADSAVQTLLGLTDAVGAGSTATDGTGGVNGLGNYNYEVVQNGQNISVKKLTNVAQSGTSTTTIKGEVFAAEATFAATVAASNALTFGANELDLFETGDAVQTVGSMGANLPAENTTYYINKASATTATFHLTAKDAKDGINAVTLTGTPTTSHKIKMVNGIQANPGSNASDADWYLNAGTPANKTKDTGTEIDLNTNTSALHTSGSAEASEMTLEFQGNDTFNMTIEGQAISAAVAGGSVATYIATINGNATLAAAGVTAEAVTGNSWAILLKRADGTSLDITGFSATNHTDVLSSPGSQQGVVKTLSSKTAVTAGNVAAAGLAEATTASLSFSSRDEVAFRLSDGTTTSTVRFTDTHAGGTTGANLQAELNSALVGSDITAAVVVSGNGVSISLTNATGGKIDLSEFQTKGSGTATFQPGTLQGNAVILNDDTTTAMSGKAINEISFATQNASIEALDIVDKALQSINDMRAELGAVTNRLDHTISNLGNIVMNTEASQSRIEDADFAAETSALTRSQILTQAATAMLAQANASKQSVLSLLQG